MPGANVVKDGIVTGGTDAIGQPIDRVDGRRKTTGGAKYAADFAIENLAHAVLFSSTIAKGRITKLDTSAAEKMPGVIAVISRRNAPKLYDVQREPRVTIGQPGQTMALLQDDEVHYYGQFLGIVIAETLEQARHAASLVKIDYAPASHTIDMDKPIGELIAPPSIGRGDKPDSKRGDPDSAFASAPVQIKQTYITPIESHNPMELHATIAQWADEKLTLHDATQHINGTQSVVAAYLGVPGENISVTDPFVGGGFGDKGSIWPHSYLAAIASRHIGRPVKLVLSRAQMFPQTGFRPKTVQTISLGADSGGKLVSVIHECVNSTSDFDSWCEPSAKMTPMMYSCPNLRISHRLARINTGTPCQMRAPGEASGMAAFEIALDELAYAVKVDPLEIRLRNYSERDEGKDKPFSSKALRACYEKGAERFGWSKRSMQPRSMRAPDGRLMGWGIATATYPTNQSPSGASIEMQSDGGVTVRVASHDLGTGTYTILTQIAAAGLGVPVNRITTMIGDSKFPHAPVAGGSQSAASVGSAVHDAAKRFIERVAHLSVNDSSSPLAGADAKKIIARDGRIMIESGASEAITAAFKRTCGRPIFVNAEAVPSKDSEKYSKHAWGAQFAEVCVDPDLCEIRVMRLVGAFSAGRVLNLKTATSQVRGGMIMGVGAALLEHVELDHRGKMVNDNLADYHVCVNRDIPFIDAFFVDEPDDKINPLGAKGIGELGITGITAAVANAVFHATGKRVREYPITIEKLLM